ncbi:unnamed protein product [Bursaphelenchus xylophilus]|uniref:(pine wood nematode) hypothetical protein n=1 Tax=Bursaphelenchus xylophilus TaxID=6326 RepID=A0A1I7S2E6_BURXY|nr:unnamed protein product [Bursaphelenchus xylophilus]CAG9114617.1 unnamed protein product [Bursaphelenchus xylophilus]
MRRAMTVTALNMTWLVRSVTRSVMLQSGKRMRKYANQQDDDSFDGQVDRIDGNFMNEEGFEQKGFY